MKRPITGLVCCLIIISANAHAQESLDTLLARGFVAEWLVCGPFASDLDDGIAQAAADGRLPLGDHDFMAKLGGVSRVRPSHLLKVPTAEGEAIWQRAGSPEASFDLGPFFPNEKEGISYAAVFVNAPSARRVYIDLQSVLGVRSWLNGFPLRESKAAPLPLGGVDRFIANFRQGTNLLILEIPGARYDAVASAMGSDVSSLKGAMLRNRPALSGKSGFEFAIGVGPVSELGDLVFVPRLESTGLFSGYAGDARQDTLLTVFNPETDTGPPVEFGVTMRGAAAPLKGRIPPMPSLSRHQALISLPVSGTEVGDSIRATITLTTESDTASFVTSVTTRASPKPGTVHVIETLQTTVASDDAFKALGRRLAVALRTPDYGLSLGEAPLWKPFLALHPEYRAQLREGAATARLGAASTYSTLDERIVAGELLVRNALYGYHLSGALLGAWNPVPVITDATGLAPQSPQILRDMGATGIVLDLDVPGLPPVAYYQALNGERLLARRKAISPPTSTNAQLRQTALLQRKHLLDLGINTDLIVRSESDDLSTSFWLNEAATLRASLPSVRSLASGPRAFFDDLAYALPRLPAPVRTKGRDLAGHHPGDLLALPEIKKAHAHVQALTLQTEKFATLAALLGAQYPAQSIDYAWRQLLHHGTPTYLNHQRDHDSRDDSLAAYRHTAAVLTEVLGNALDYIADQANTYDKAPIRAEGDLALVVFNSMSWPRTDLVDTYLELPQAAGITLLDSVGTPVRFHADRVTRSNSRITGARVRFVAQDVPPFGYKTYYLRPSGELPAQRTESTLTIENDFLSVTLDPERGGVIASVIDKKSGRELVKDAWSEVLAFPEDETRTNGGADLWTSGAPVSSSSARAEVEIRVTPGVQQATITSEHATQTLTLYDGLPRIHCAIRLEAPSNDALVAIAHQLPTKDLVPVFGERFGSIVGRNNPVSNAFQTDPRDPDSAAGPRPFLRWVALADNDRIHTDTGLSFPIPPTAIVHSSDLVLSDAASRLRTALLSRGIPADTWPDTLPEKNAVWSDSTDFENFDDDERFGTGFRVLLGGPEFNAFTEALRSRLTGDEAAKLDSAVADHTPVVIMDGATPTLLITGLDGAKIAKHADAVALAIKTNGAYTAATTAATASARAQQPQPGLAVLTRGAGLAATQSGNTLLQFIGRGDATAEYWLLPFLGTWRQALPQLHGHAVDEALKARLTDLHLAPLPAQNSLLRSDPATFVVTSLAPAQPGLMTMSAKTPHPSEGMQIRGYESLGQAWGGTVDLAATPYAATRVTPNGTPVTDIFPAGKTIPFRAEPFSIETLWVQPSLRSKVGQPASIEATRTLVGPVYTRHWRYAAGASPPASQPVTVRLDGDLGRPDAPLALIVANNITDEPVSGVVDIAVPDGWHVSPGQIEYTLAALEHQKSNLVLLRDEPLKETGGISARTTLNGRDYRDVLTLSRESVELTGESKGFEVHVTVRNKSGIPLEGYLDLTVPLDQWPELNNGATPSVSPHRRGVRVQPFATKKFIFYRKGETGDIPYRAKLSANGAVYRLKIEAGQADL